MVLDGTRIDSTSTLDVLRSACRSLGISDAGSRAQLFKRLVYHLKHQEMLAAHSVKHNLAKELQRSVNQPGIPQQPTEQEVQEHNMTHIPFKPWCELCIAHKGRQDKHHRESHSSSTFSVVSFDFGYADRGTDDSLTVLFMHDRSTKMMHAVPTPARLRSLRMSDSCLKFNSIRSNELRLDQPKNLITTYRCTFVLRNHVMSCPCMYAYK